MPTVAVAKSMISLQDYDYQLDINNRLLLAELSVFEVEVLEEILNSSLRFPIDELADMLDCETDDISFKAAVAKFQETGLIKIEGSRVTMDKERRKYYETQVEKFDEDFEPNIDFLQGLLKKVPIHVLPNWYSIPRSSDNILDSLIERHLQTPRIYSRYLMELNFEDPILSGIMNDVMSSPALKVRSKVLRERYSLSRIEFEECMLMLEFSFVCCLSYTKVGDQWKEVVTPFHEWRQFLRYRRRSLPRTLAKSNDVIIYRDGDFAFIRDMEFIIRQALDTTYTMDADFVPGKKQVKQLIEEGGYSFDTEDELLSYAEHVLAKLSLLRLGESDGSKLVVTDLGREFLEMGREEQAHFLHKHPRNLYITEGVDINHCTDRNQREVERSLDTVAGAGWIFFDDYFASVLVPLGDCDGAQLVKRGKTWTYVLPKYPSDIKDFVKAAIFEKLFEAGLVTTGMVDDKPCFQLTNFGRSQILDD